METFIKCMSILTKFSSFVMLVFIVFLQTNSFNLFKFFRIVFPISLVFYTQNFINFVSFGMTLLASKGDFTHLARFLYSCNKWSFVFTFLFFVYQMTYEIFKIRVAPNFYYGRRGTSPEDD